MFQILFFNQVTETSWSKPFRSILDASQAVASAHRRHDCTEEERSSGAVARRNESVKR